MQPITSGPLASIAPDLQGGRRPDRALVALLVDRPGARPEAGPDPVVLPADFPGRFASAVADLAPAIRAVQSRRREMEDLRAHHPRPGFRRARLRHARATDRYYDAAAVVADLLRSLTGGRRVPYPAWATTHPSIAAGWATVEFGGSVYSLDHCGIHLTVRPAALALRLPGVACSPVHDAPPVPGPGASSR